MKPESCPDPEELRSFVRCSVNEQQADRISEHLDHCPACEETVVGLERDGDTIAGRIKQAAAQPTFAHEPECQQLMQSLLDGTAMCSPERATADAPVQVAEILRDYQIVAKLGEGGMGTVYKAVHQRLKKTVALKVLPTNRIGDQPAVARFEREMEVLGQLNHPHIVQALDAGEHEGQHYLVMEYVEGCDLSDIIKRCSPLPVADACELISQAAAGLQYAHENGFVHRDIKPSNLMLATGAKASAPIVKILDLGLARALDQRTEAAAPKTELTTAGQVMGTLDYMAPEQGGDAHQVDIRADIYSLGATLYKLLTGDSPYADHAHKPPLQRLMAIAHHEPPAIRTKRRDIPEKLAVIVHRMLAKKPEQRFATPADVVQALAPFCAGADLAALIVPSGPTRIIGSTSATTTPFTATADRNGVGRRLRTALAGFAAFLALAAVIVISTRNGTVEVTAPGAKLPDDVKVVVSRGGEEVEVLQAENQWSAKIVNGEYRVELRGGADRFEIKNSKLTVSRMGRSVVTLQMQPAKEPNAATVAALPTTPAFEPSNPAAQPTKADIAPDPEKPFALIRDDKVVRDFKTWAGMLADLQAGDTIEVQGRGPYLLPKPPFKHLDVTVRAAAGFRPELRLPGAVIHNASLKFEGLDLVFPHDDRDAGSFWFFKDGRPRIPPPRLEINHCRVAAYAISTSQDGSVKVSDSLLLLVTSIGIPDDGEADFDNNVVVFSEGGFRIPQGGSHVRLTNNTIVAWGRLLFFGHPDATLPERPVRIESRNNLIANDAGFGGASIFFGQSAEKNAAAIDWQGAENLYCPYPQAGFTEKNNDGQTVQVEPLDAWARKLNRTEREPNSQIAAWPQWKLAEAWWAKDADHFATLRRQIESAIPPQQRHEIGPQWELIGPGAAYLKALAVAGTPVAEKDLLPEALAGGPCVILRDGKEIQGFRTLQDACSTAVDKDVIELRTNNNVGGTTLNGKGRLVTIRAAAGYTPQADLISVTNGERIVVEGIQFTLKGGLDGYQADKTVPSGQYVRIANCSIRNQGTRGGTQGIPMFSVSHGTGAAGAPLEILNCWVDGTVMVGVRADQKIRFHNCILPGVDPFPALQENKDAWHTIEFDRCAVWSPEPRAYRGGLTWTSTSQPIHIEVVANNTLFEAHSWIRRPQNSPLRWKGSHNLFRIGNPDWFHVESMQFISGLDELRTTFQSDVDSFEAKPLAWEPEQWKLLPGSPGFQAGPEGRDMGADVDRLIRSIGRDSSDHAASPANGSLNDATRPLK